MENRVLEPASGRRGRRVAKLLVLYANFPRPYEYENFLLERVAVSVPLTCSERCPSSKILATTQHYAIEHANSIESSFALHYI